MTMHAYQEFYLDDVKRHLSTMFDYAINTCAQDTGMFCFMFLKSSVCKGLDNGNPLYLSGMSGYEMAKTVIEESTQGPLDLPKPDYRMAKSPEYWAGWALAQYHWYSGRNFRSIFRKASFGDIVSMYHPYHEMDISRFIERMDEILEDPSGKTNLKELREKANMTQAQLAEASGINIRNIQMYEQKCNSIDKAQAVTLFRLARVLRCSIEDLLENPAAD